MQHQIYHDLFLPPRNINKNCRHLKVWCQLLHKSWLAPLLQKKALNLERREGFESEKRFIWILVLLFPFSSFLCIRYVLWERTRGRKLHESLTLFCLKCTSLFAESHSVFAVTPRKTRKCCMPQMTPEYSCLPLLSKTNSYSVESRVPCT